jgi:phage tail-like protein
MPLWKEKFMLIQQDRVRGSNRASGGYIMAAAIGVVVLTAFMHDVPVQAQQGRVVSSERLDSQQLAKFALVVDGVELGVFTQLISTADLETGAARPTIALMGGQTQNKNIEMAAWHELVILGDVAAARRKVSIIVYGTSGNPANTYALKNAWPAKLTLGNAGEPKGDVAVEGIVLTHEGFEVE